MQHTGVVVAITGVRVCIYPFTRTQAGLKLPVLLFRSAECWGMAQTSLQSLVAEASLGLLLLLPLYPLHPKY